MRVIETCVVVYKMLVRMVEHGEKIQKDEDTADIPLAGFLTRCTLKILSKWLKTCVYYTIEIQQYNATSQ